ncbi:MAG: NUDIX domain-containing protein [Actinobacteria bacterium]|nr:NUDIX domain-containing protein [Actinomycetota bacterium]
MSAEAAVRAVETAGLGQQPGTPTFDGARPSAVLVALADGPAGAEVLLTKRAGHLRNHAGEISFPGGRIEPGETAVQAAIREAHEEVALAPAAVQVRGELSHLSTVVSRSYIVPLVAHLGERPSLIAEVTEVERILWVPLTELAHGDTYREEWWGTPPLDRRMNFFELDDETVWGATAHVLYELLCVVYGPPATRTAL